MNDKLIQNGQALTGGQMPTNGVPEKAPQERPAVQIIEQNQPARVASAAPEAPKLATVNLEAINRQAAQQQAAKVAPQRKLIS